MNGKKSRLLGSVSNEKGLADTLAFVLFASGAKLPLILLEFATHS
jgi:hypothetical protein